MRSEARSSSDVTPSGRSPGNANHLLGFRYHNDSSGGGGSGDRGRSGGGRGSRRAVAASSWKPKPFRKEHFLQANFRFVVSDGVDAQRYTEQADRMFDWEDILQVRAARALLCMRDL